MHLSEGLASGFRKEQGQAITVKGTLGREYNLLKKGLTDLIISTEDLSALFPEAEFGQSIIAYDQTIMIVHPSNKVKKISQKDLAKIFTEEITKWASLGGGNRGIQIFTRESGAAIRLSFEKNFLKLDSKNYKHLSLNALAVNSNPEMRSAVSKIPGSIGYISVGALNDSVKKLFVHEDSSSKDEVKSPKLTIFAIWNKDGASPTLERFLGYLEHSPIAQKIIQEEGYLLSGK